MIILLGSEKGGVGKSNLAQNLSVLIAQSGGDVLLVDADPQETSYEWAAERESMREKYPKAALVHYAKASGEIREWLKEKATRYKHIVIDAGGADSNALRAAMTIADYMIIPFRPKRRDLKTLPNIASLMRMALSLNPDLQVRALVSQCPALPSQVYRILDAKQACESFGLPTLNAITMNRNSYDDAEEDGLSVLENNIDPKAEEEIRAIALELWGNRSWQD
ncbi:MULTISPECIES: AAA family ATPase [unclassified Pseudomonas]|uniref:AAA family ATPase n=1 Tax=unclassified Pseudomonas TaxID=196821 RepID=UPI000A1EDC82|nr:MULTISPECIES: AAA family ATPase [unclassified Pseudomonas]